MFQAAQLPEHLNYTGTLNLNKGLHVHVHDKAFYISVSPKQKRTLKKNQCCISAESVVAKVFSMPLKSSKSWIKPGQ